MDYKDIDYNELEFYTLLPAGEKHHVVLETAFGDDMFRVSAGEVTYTEPILTKSAMGKRQCDLLPFNDGVNKAVSDKILELLKSNNITGWSSYPVTIKGISKSYHGLQVTGRSGKLIEPEKQDEDDYSYRGIKFAPDSWDGSDMFFPEGSNLPVITARLKHLLDSNDITNIEIIHIKDSMGFY